MAASNKKCSFIDEFDLGRIVRKSSTINQIIEWLNRLVELDQTIDKKAVQAAIEMLKDKKDILDEKAKKARDYMAEEAELIASGYDTED